MNLVKRHPIRMRRSRNHSVWCRRKQGLRKARAYMLRFGIVGEPSANCFGSWGFIADGKYTVVFDRLGEMDFEL